MNECVNGAFGSKKKKHNPILRLHCHRQPNKKKMYCTISYVGSSRREMLTVSRENRKVSLETKCPYNCFAVILWSNWN